MLDDLVVVGNVEFDGIHGQVEGPAELVLPYCFYDNVFQVLKLVGLPTRGVLSGLDSREDLKINL